VIIRNLDKDLGKNGDYSGKFRGANMAKQFKARKFLSIIALFSFIAIQPQPIQAGFWSWITWPFYALFDSDKDAEQPTRPTPSRDLEMQEIQPEKIKKSANRSLFSRISSWGSNFKSFVSSLFSRKPKNSTLPASPEASDANNDNQTSTQESSKPQAAPESQPTNPHDSMSNQEKSHAWLENINAETSADHSPRPSISPSSSETDIVLRNCQAVDQQALSDEKRRMIGAIALNNAKIIFDPTRQTLTFNIPSQINPENMNRFIIDTRDSQHLAKNLRNALTSLSEQDLQRLCECFKLPMNKEKSHIISDIFSHLQTRISKQLPLQTTVQQNDGSDRPLVIEDLEVQHDISSESCEIANESGIDDFLDAREASEEADGSSYEHINDTEGSSFTDIQASNPAALVAHETFALHKNRIRQYCETYAQENNLNANEYLAHVVQQVNLGGRYAYQILNGQLAVSKDKATLQSIIETLMWYFYSEHLGQSMEGNGFEEGTFIVPKEFAPFFEAAGYHRISSHAKLLNPGTNIGNDSDNLPQSKGHILSLQLHHPNLKNYCLIKPENHGTSGIKNTAFHLIEFAQAQIRKIKFFQQTFGMKSDDDEAYRKERIPSDIKKQYQELVQDFRLGNAETEKFIKDASIGIFAIYKNAKSLDNSKFNLTLRKKARAFISMLESRYDHLNIRIGREVILSKEDLLLSSWIYDQKTNSNQAPNNEHPCLASAITLINLKALMGQQMNGVVTNKSLDDAIKAHIESLAETSEQALKNISNSLLKEYLVNTVTICNDLQSRADFLDHICNTQFFEYDHQQPLVHQIKLNRCKEEINAEIQRQFSDLIEQYPYQSNSLSGITVKTPEDDKLKKALEQLNNESTGMKKITEFRMILGGNFSSLKSLVTRFCNTITNQALRLYEEGKIKEAIELCQEVHDKGIKIINNAIKQATKNGFYTPQHHAGHLIQIRTIALQRYAADCYRKNAIASGIVKAIDNIVESFEQQAGFFPDQTTLETTIDEEYTKALETIKAAVDQTRSTNSDIRQKNDVINDAIYEEIKTSVENFVTSSQKALNPTQSAQADIANTSYSQLSEQELSIQFLGEDSGPRRLHQLRSVLTNEQLDALLKQVNDQVISGIRANNLHPTKSQLQELMALWNNTLTHILNILHNHGIYTNYHPDLKPVIARYTSALRRLEKQRARHYKKEAQHSIHTESIGELFEQSQLVVDKNHEQSASQLLLTINAGMSAMIHQATTGIIVGHTQAEVLSTLEDEVRKIEQQFSEGCTTQTNPSVRALLDLVEHDTEIIDRYTL